MPCEKQDAVRISKSSWSSHVVSVQRRRHLHARSATVYSPLARGRSLFVATVLRRTGLLPLSSWCWQNRSDAPNAWRRLCDGRPECPVHLRPVQSRLPSQPPWLELLRSSDFYRGLLGRFLLIMFAMLRMCRQDFFRVLDCWPNDNVTAIRSRNRAANQNHFFGFAYLHHLQVLHSDAFIAEVTWHSHVLPNTPRSRTIADCTNAPVRLRTVRRTLSVEVVLLHYALESFSFRPANYIHV